RSARTVRKPRSRREVAVKPNGLSGGSPMNATRVWPRSTRWVVARRPPCSSSVTTIGTSSPRASTSTTGTPAATRRASPSGGRGREGDDEEAGGAVAAGEGGQVLGAVLGRLDVEQHEVEAGVAQAGDDAPEALDGRGVGEERDHDADGVGPAAGQPPGERVGA